jgi:hypothetical protein
MGHAFALALAGVTIGHLEGGGYFVHADARPGEAEQLAAVFGESLELLPKKLVAVGFEQGMIGQCIGRGIFFALPSDEVGVCYAGAFAAVEFVEPTASAHHHQVCLKSAGEYQAFGSAGLAVDGQQRILEYVGGIVGSTGIGTDVTLDPPHESAVNIAQRSTVIVQQSLDVALVRVWHRLVKSSVAWGGREGWFFL